jgi:PAS domain S-box-containing protein
MKHKLVVFHILFLFVLFSIGVISFMGSYPWITTSLSAIALAAVSLIFKSWMDFINALLTKSEESLFQTSHPKATGWLNNLERLESNHHRAAKKFAVAAQLIADLSHPEKAGTMNDLIADDPIGKALHTIRSEMKTLKEEDEKKTWITKGLAGFSTILRNKGDVNEYGYSIISYMVNYLRANQGGLFIEYKNQEGERYLELTSCYAYEKRKYLENKIQEGQGLLGQCMLEKEYLFITDVPKDYVKITSGLGEATPRNVIVAPLIFNDVFCGAIELASFEILQPHQMDFLRKASDHIASEIFSLKNTANTKKLLQESEALTQELQSHEEEMRQNIEELAATQEEMSRKQNELSGIIHAIDATLATAELNLEGKIIKYNSVLEDFLENSNSSSLLARDYTLITGNQHEEISWNHIRHGLVKSGDFRIISQKKNEVWLAVTFTPITDVSGTTIKFLCMIQNITQRKIKEREADLRQAELKSYLNGIDHTIASAEFDLRGDFKDANEIFLKVMGFTKEELKDRDFEFLMGDDQAVIMMWETLRLGKFFSGEFKMKNKGGKDLWLTGTFNPITIEHNKPEKVMMFAQFTTQEKEKVNDLQAMVQALKSTLPVIEFSSDFTCKTANEKAMKLLGFSRLDLRSKDINDFISSFYHGMWLKKQKEILGTPFSRLLLPFGEDDKMTNFEVSISVNRNADGSIGKIIMLLVKEVHDRIPVLVAI